MPSYNHFDFLAPVYDRFIKPTDINRFCAIARLPVTGRLLDAGGGTGGKSFPLISMVTAIVIADSSRGMLSQAKNKKGLLPVRSETEHLPIGSESFERVIMVDAMHHVQDFLSTVSELWRIVKPGGCIVIEEPDIHTVSTKIMAAVEKLALMRSHFVSPQEIASAFAFPNAEVEILGEGSIAWIVVSKLASG